MSDCNSIALSAKPEQNLHLLLVEDSALDVELIIATLRRAGIQFTHDVVYQAAPCQQLLQSCTYDAVLSDYALPEFDAYRTLELLQQSKQDIPLILVTGALGEEAAVDCIKAGMTDYVLKDRLFRLPMSLQRSLNDFALRRQKEAAFAQIQQQAQQEQLLNQMSQILNSSLNPSYILQEIAKLTGQCFQVDRVLLMAIEAEQVWVMTEWLASNQVTSMLDFVAPVEELFDKNEFSSGIYYDQPFCISDYATLPETAARLELSQQRQVRSLLSVPIFIRDRFFGGLSLHTTTTYRTFSDSEIQLLQRIANQAAIALHNAQNYEQLEKLVQRRTQELEQEKLFSESANRSKTEFLAHMSHELRTPLTGILGFSSVLLKQVFGPLNLKQQQYAEGISNCGQHLLELINDLLDLSKVEAGREELFLEPVLVQEVCDACIDLSKELAHDRDLRVSMTISPAITTCIADKRRLKQILVNLLGNAVKFTPSGSVTLEVTQMGDWLHFAVTDTGMGIAADDLSRLFQPFQQLDGGLNRQYEGTGLGLNLSRKLAQLHGGDITITSEVGRGSCFTLYLPIAGPG